MSTTVMANTYSSSPAPRAPKSGDGDGKKRRYTFSLSFAGLLTSGIIMIIAVGWVFAFGVIVGRGYNPEKQLPELAKLLPPPEGQTEAQALILKPEELTFMSDLKQRNANASSSSSAKPESTQAPQSAHAVTPPQSAPASTPPPVIEKKPRFNYAFQAVAYKKKAQADTLRKRMEGEGLRTRMTIEKDAAGKPKWYRIQVLVRGTEEDAAAAKQIMNRLGVHEPRLTSKKPVSTAKPASKPANNGKNHSR